MVERIGCIDIDGVLNYYPEPWLKFLYNKGHSYTTLDEAKQNLSYKEYTGLKKDYRHSDVKRSQTPRKDSVEFTRRLSEMGYKVILKTTRPVKEHPHLVEWTYDWLRENGYCFDDVLFTRYNPQLVLSRYPGLSFMVDDELETVKFYMELGVKTYLFTGDYNIILGDLDEISDNNNS